MFPLSSFIFQIANWFVVRSLFFSTPRKQLYAAVILKSKNIPSDLWFILGEDVCLSFLNIKEHKSEYFFLSWLVKIFLTSLQKTKILKWEVSHHQVHIENVWDTSLRALGQVITQKNSTSNLRYRYFLLCLFQRSWLKIPKLSHIFFPSSNAYCIYAYFSCLRFQLKILILGRINQPQEVSWCFHVCPWFLVWFWPHWITLTAQVLWL